MTTPGGAFPGDPKDPIDPIDPIDGNDPAVADGAGGAGDAAGAGAEESGGGSTVWNAAQPEGGAVDDETEQAQAMETAALPGPPPAQPWGAAPAPVPTSVPLWKRLDWTVWFYGGAMLLTFLTAFLPLRRAAGSAKLLGEMAFSVNWWGSLSFSSSLGAEFLGEALTSDFTSGMEVVSIVFILTTLMVLILQALTTYVAYAFEPRICGITGVQAFIVQLFLVILTGIPLGDDGALGRGAGWWFWLLISLVGLVVSLFVLIGRKSVLESGFNTARAKGQKQLKAGQQAWAQRQAQQAQAAQAAQAQAVQQPQAGFQQSGFQQQQWQQPQWGQPQAPQQPNHQWAGQQQPQAPQQQWGQPQQPWTPQWGQTQGQWGQPQAPQQWSQPQQQPWTQPQQPWGQQNTTQGGWNQRPPQSEPQAQAWGQPSSNEGPWVKPADETTTEGDNPQK